MQLTRRGNSGDWIMSFVFILMIIFIVGSLVGGYFLYFRGEYDSRNAELSFLMQRVSECFAGNDFFASNFDFYAACNLNEIVGKQYLVLIEPESGEPSFFIGVYDYVNQCELTTYANRPICASGTLSKDGISYSILIAANQKARSVSA